MSNRRSRQMEKRVLFILQWTALLLCLSMIILSGILVFSLLLGGDSTVADSTKQTDNTIAIQTLSSTVPTTAVETTPPASVEFLPENAACDLYFGKLPICENPKEVTRTEMKAVYIGKKGYFDRNTELANNSEVNAFVIDLKESDGVWFNSKNELALEMGVVKSAYNLKETVEQCHANGIKVIGRIVTFKDPDLAAKKPEYSIQDKDGNQLFFTVENNNPFVSPYDTRVWDYNIDLAIEAIEAGVDEIQFDYVRFPAGADRTTSGTTPYFGETDTIPTKSEVINRFLQYARIRIQEEYGVPVSADVFATILSSESDGYSIGQDWATVGLTGIDSVCPMIYPSHYSLGTSLNGKVFDRPDYYPYDIMYNALMVGKAKASVENYAVVRPYLQAFSYSGSLVYEYPQINEQIKALNDAGYTEWILWNPSALYPSGVYDGVN